MVHDAGTSSAWQLRSAGHGSAVGKLNFVIVKVRFLLTSLHEASPTGRGQVHAEGEQSRAAAHNLGVWHSSRQSLSFRVKRARDWVSDWLAQ